MSHNLVIEDVEVQFPFKPYHAQVAFMTQVLKSLSSEHQYALLESPTGTGKTLSLLCSILAWQQKQKTLVPEIPPVIIYASRTHSQLSQVVNELKRTCYRPKVAMLSSRANLCVNPSVKNSPELRSKCRSLTKSRSCRFKENIDRFLQQGTSTFSVGVQSTGFLKSNESFNDDSKVLKTNRILDIEELGNFGQQENVCPYFLSRNESVQNDAELVFMPYNYLVDPAVREGLGVRWENSVIVIDEAHNLEHVCDEAASFSITSVEITLAMKELDYISKNSYDAVDPSSFRRVELFLTGLEDSMVAPQLLKTDSGMGKELPGSAIFDIFFNHKTAVEFKHVAALLEPMKTIIESGAGPATNLETIQKACKALTRSCEIDARANANQFFYVYLNEDATASRQLPKPRVLNFWCFSPAVALKELMQLKVFSLMLTSGTLAPLNSFASQFRLEFPVRLENPHVVDPSQFWIGVVPIGPTNKRLNSVYSNRESPEYLSELGSTIVNYSRVVPAGMLVFFPSYRALDASKSHWTKHGVWDRIEQHKRIIVEARTASQMVLCVQKYEAEIAKGNGVVFFAVCRGKASEGIDFSDKKARAVIITGLPYPPLKDPRVMLKKKFLGKISAAPLAIGESLSPTEWYSQQAHRAVNQAIGRVIRHRNDYGAILLCDDRFGNESTKQYLSLWLRPHMRVMDKFSDSIGQLSRFFKLNAAKRKLNQERKPLQVVNKPASSKDSVLPSASYFERMVSAKQESNRQESIGTLLQKNQPVNLDLKRKPGYHQPLGGPPPKRVEGFEENARKLVQAKMQKERDLQERENAPTLNAKEFMNMCKLNIDSESYTRFKNVLKNLQSVKEETVVDKRILQESLNILLKSTKPQILLANFKNFLPILYRTVFLSMLME